MPLTTVLDANNLILTPVIGTPLDALVKATRSDPLFNYVADINTPNGITIQEYTPDVVNIEYIANVRDPVLNTNAHDLVMDDIVEVASNAVRGHIIFAKNVVAPAVENLVERTMVRLGQLAPTTLTGMEVIVWNPPKPLMSNSLENAVRKFESLAIDSPKMNIQCPDVTAAQLFEIMKSGSGGLDAYIDEWAAIKGESFFLNIWQNVFRIKQAELNERIPVTFKNWVYDSPDSVDNALVIYLLSRKLLDDPLENTETNIDTYNNTILEYRNQSAARLCLAFDELDKIDKGGILVRDISNNTTTVNGSVYDKWITEGNGDNEILFGNILNIPSMVCVDEITANADKLKTIWSRHATLIATVERNKLFSRTKEILLYEFMQQQQEVSDSSTTLENRERITTAFTECLDNMREDEIQDLWDCCLKLLTVSRFANTEARRILLGIERIKKEHPEIDVREAAAISVLEYVSYWMCTQFKATVI